jgi:hypothetical protein
MLRQIEARRSVNVFAYLRHIRKQRQHLVQTVAQYIFCHTVLLEAVQAGLTELPIATLPTYLDEVNNPFEGSIIVSYR